MKKYRSFSSENFQFLEMKCSIYFNRRVFVMVTIRLVWICHGKRVNRVIEVLLYFDLLHDHVQQKYDHHKYAPLPHPYTHTPLPPPPPPTSTPFPVNILYKSTTGRSLPVREADGPITASCRFIKNASWVSLTLPLQRHHLHHTFSGRSCVICLFQLIHKTYQFTALITFSALNSYLLISVQRASRWHRKKCQWVIVFLILKVILNMYCFHTMAI